MTGRPGSRPPKSRGSLPLSPACFAVGFNILIFVSKSLSEMLLVSTQDHVLGCSSKTFACASLESKAAVCLLSYEWQPVSGHTRLQGTNGFFMITFTGIRKKGHSVHPVCCTILMVTKAWLHFPSALPSRELQCSCKPAVLHSHSKTEPFCLLQLLFTIFSFTLPSFSFSPYFWFFTDKVVAERQVHNLKCATRWDLAPILRILNIRQLSLFVIWSKVKNDSWWVGTKGWCTAALAAVELERLDFSQSFKHLAEALICCHTETSLPVRHDCSTDSTFKIISTSHLQMLCWLLNRDVPVLASPVYLQSCRKKKNLNFPFYPWIKDKAESDSKHLF